MDLAAFCQCRDYNLPIRVFNINKSDALYRVMTSYEEAQQYIAGSISYEYDR